MQITTKFDVGQKVERFYKEKWHTEFVKSIAFLVKEDAEPVILYTTDVNVAIKESELREYEGT